MAINLTTKYAKPVVDKFYVESILANKGNTKFSWDGARSVVVRTITTVTPNEYTRTGLNRFGTPEEVQDTAQTLEIKQEYGNELTVDAGNNTQQDKIKGGLAVIAAQLREQMVPLADKHGIGVLEAGAGKMSADGTLTKSNIVEKIMGASTHFINAGVPETDNYLLLPASKYTMLRLSPEFVGLEALGNKSVAKGVVGEVAGFQVVKVPDNYFAGTTNFIVMNKQSFCMPWQLKTAKVLEDVQGLDGHLCQIRWLFDAFVLDAKKDGVYLSKTA